MLWWTDTGYQKKVDPRRSSLDHTMSTSKSEQSYIVTSLVADPPLRADGRELLDYRPIALETQVADLANGSARVSIGGASLGGLGVGGGIASTEVLAAAKLEVENVGGGKDGRAEGRIVVHVTWYVLIDCKLQRPKSDHCSPSSAYPHYTNNALDDLQEDYTTVLQEALTHPSIHPTNLVIIPNKRSWLLHLDLVVLADNGNIYDALFLAASAALRDTRVPRTKVVEYKARVKIGEKFDEDTEMTDVKEGAKAPHDANSGLNTRTWKNAAEFELEDYWDDGEALKCSGPWPVCITMNYAGSKHFLDATLAEESAISSRLLLFYSIPATPDPMKLQGMRLLGHGEAKIDQIKLSIKVHSVSLFL